MDVLKKHYEPKTLVIAEHFQFHRRNQAVGESVAEYIAGLRRLTRHCEFGAYLDDAFRDRFVCGLRSETIQKNIERRLSGTNLSSENNFADVSTECSSRHQGESESAKQRCYL